MGKTQYRTSTSEAPQVRLQGKSTLNSPTLNRAGKSSLKPTEPTLRNVKNGQARHQNCFTLPGLKLRGLVRETVSLGDVFCHCHERSLSRLFSH